MNNIKNKILKAIENNKLNPMKLGYRRWYNYNIKITELVWSRNLHDGYLIDVYDLKNNHLDTIRI